MENGEGIAQKLFDEGKISPQTIRLISEEAFCETFHKLPHEVGKMDSFKFDAFMAIIRGRSKGMKNNNPKK